MATPQVMFDPARLCTSGRPARSRMAASMAAVVVLPLVADTSTEPSSRRRPMVRIAPGLMRSSIRPGAVVPPLRPSPRLVARSSRASASSGSRHQEAGPAGTTMRRQRLSTVIVAGVVAIGSPSA